MYYDPNDFENFDEGRDVKQVYCECAICDEQTLNTCSGCDERICQKHQVFVRKHFDRCEMSQFYTYALCEDCAWLTMMPDPEIDARVFREQLLNLRRRIDYWWRHPLSTWDPEKVRKCQKAA